MPALTAILYGIAAVTAMASSFHIEPPAVVPVVRRFITSDMQIASVQEKIVMIGNLCDHPKGSAVNITVDLPSNPNWDPGFGVVWFSVSSGESGSTVSNSSGKPTSDVLCTNNVSGAAVPHCNVPSWPGGDQIYVTANSGYVDSVVFAAQADFFTKTRNNEVANIQPRPPLRQTTVLGTRPVRSKPVYLTEIFTIFNPQSLDYHGTALINTTFCPTPQTGTRYSVQSVVAGTDGSSIFVQYICDQLPCTVDGPNVIAHSGSQLPIDVLTLPAREWKSLYVLVVCWGGDYDPTKGQIVGHFLYQAAQM